MQRHLALLRSELRPGEEERLWVRAERVPHGHVGALVLSSRRLLFSGLGFAHQSQEGWPLAAIRRVQVVPGRPATLGFEVLALTERFVGTEEDLARAGAALAAAIPEEVGEGEPGARAALLDELERLSALRDSGALTEAEFRGAKRRLLD